MERQRSFSLPKPKTFLLNLLLSFLLSLWALRTAPLHFAGGHQSAKSLGFSVSPGGFSENASQDSVLEETHFAEALDSGMEVKGAVLGAAHWQESGGDSAKDPISEETHHSSTVRALDSEMEVKDAVPGAAHRTEGSNSAKDAVLREAHLAEAGNLSAQASDAAEHAKAANLRRVRARERGDSSKQKGNTSPPREAIEPMEQRKSSNLSAVRNGFEKAETGNSIQEAVSNDTHSGRGNAASPQEAVGSIEQSRSSSFPEERSGASQCDVYDGDWVFDESYPLYKSNSCPFIDEGFSCEANGRMDQDYMKWRWQPRHCNIPRFSARKMLEMIRGKRLVFVGDSINRNQWESMMCLLREAAPDPTRIREARGRRITKGRGDYNFKFLDYNCSVEYHVTHFLVHEGKARTGLKRTKTLRIDAVDRSSSKWRGADVLVFNTAHWWSHHKTEAGVNYYQEKDYVHPHLDASTAFHKALNTWASWVDQHINPRKTQVFFRSSAPSHFSGGEWNSGGHCKESTLPVNDTSVRPVSGRNLILEQVVKQMKKPVTVLNITNLSGLRIDGHPSIYGRRPGAGTPSNTQDCSHWCLPGVPDTWNELLYYHLISRQEQVLTS